MRSLSGTGWAITPSSSSSSTASTVWDMISFNATRSGAGDSYSGPGTRSSFWTGSGSGIGSGSGTGSGWDGGPSDGSSRTG